MMAIGDGYAVICLDSIKDLEERSAVIQSLTSTGKEIIDISLDQMNRFAGNMLQVLDRSDKPHLIMSEQAFQSLETEQIERLSAKTSLLPVPLWDHRTDRRWKCPLHDGRGLFACLISSIYMMTTPDSTSTFSLSWSLSQTFLFTFSAMKQCSALILTFFIGLISLTGQIAINEIMYNPPEPGTDTLEYLELMNLTDVPVDVTDYYFASGIVFTFPPMMIPENGFVVVCKNAQRFFEVFGTNVLEWTTGSLDNTGETLVLANAAGQVVDSVSYSDQGGWPGLPTDGNGSSLVLCDPTGDHNDPGNWQAASTSTGQFVNGIEVKANPLPASGCQSADDKSLILTGIFDAQPGNAGTKGIEVYLLDDVADLSVYGVGSANNGGGSDGVEFTFPAIPGTKGTYYYIAADSALFRDYFGFNADYISSAVNINGDDAMEIFENSIVIDVFGDINKDGTGEPWEYLDGWVYRVNGTGPDGSTFTPENWIYSGIAALEGEPTNEEAPIPFPVGTYDPKGSVVLNANDDYTSTPQNAPKVIAVQANDFKPNPLTTFEIVEMPSKGSAVISGGSMITYTPDQDYCGSDQLTYRLCDVDGCDTASVYIQVICPKIYPSYSIGEVTTINAIGILDSMAVECQLEGVVYGVNLRPGGLQFVLIDDQNDGITVYSTDDHGYVVKEGDRLITQGRIIQYNGLAEMLTDTVWAIASNQTLFNPTIVTSFDESVESQLIQLQNVTLVDPADWTNAMFGFNVRLLSGMDTFIMRIDSDVNLFGTSPPVGSFHVTGLGTQFDETSPYLDDYQIMPRYIQDIGLINSILDPPNYTWTISPNPMVSSCKLDSEVPLHSVIVLDMTGRTVGVGQTLGDDLQWQINAENLQSGSYWVQAITTAGERVILPLIRME